MGIGYWGIKVLPNTQYPNTLRVDMQIRTRLTLQFMLIAASIMLVATLYIYFQFKTHLENELYSDLLSKANLTAVVAVGQVERQDSLGAASASPTANHSFYTENISIYAPNDERVYTFNPSPLDIKSATLSEIREAGSCRFKHGKFLAIGIKHSAPSGKEYVIISEAVFRPKPLTDLARILAIVFFAFLALVAIGGWVFAGQALAPVSHIMNQVDAVLPKDLSQRLETSNSHDELARLAITFNNMLDRIQRAFNAQKMFLSNVSHEIKNPLTVIISQIEIILQKDRPKAEYCQTLKSVLDDMREMDLMSERLMQLAKINAEGTMVEFEPLRIDELVWQAKATLLKSNPDYTINFEILNLPEAEEKLLVQGNEPLLKTALMNLMDNGCKFSSDHHVKVSLFFNGKGKPVVEFRDKGAGIAPEELATVFEPFYRSRQTASVKGTGIGLSLVDSIVKLHKVVLTVESNGSEETVFRMEFPA